MSDKKPVVKKVVKKKDNTKKVDTTVIHAGDVFLTQDGFKKLKDELSFLEKKERKRIAKRLEEAISYGDLSENSEYQEAKEEQAFIEGRIIELGRKIKNAKIIEDQHVGKVSLGSVVELQDTESQEEFKYTIVGSTEVDPFEGRISNESIIGLGVLGKKKGDVFSVMPPSGKFSYKVLSVS